MDEKKYDTARQDDYATTIAGEVDILALLPDDMDRDAKIASLIRGLTELRVAIFYEIRPLPTSAEAS